MPGTPTALVLAGGLGLGAYHAGAFAALDRSGTLDIQAIAGSSIGAINGAILAGNPPEQRAERLRAFWRRVETEAVPGEWTDPFGLAEAGPMRHLRNWTNVLTSRSTGANGLFRLRLPGSGRSAIPSIYDLEESRTTLPEFIDFDRLNSGEVRFIIAATDVETGETPIFDTAAGDRIEIDHLLASGALLPAFEPVRIGERLLVDGGLSANAPLDTLLSSERRSASPPLCIVVDLFPPDGPVPDGLLGAMERSTDLKFACQSRVHLEALRRERALEARLGNPDGTDLIYLSYRPTGDEAGSEKTYDFSPATLRDRYRAGEADAEAALERIAGLAAPEPGLRIHPIRRT